MKIFELFIGKSCTLPCCLAKNLIIFSKVFLKFPYLCKKSKTMGKIKENSGLKRTLDVKSSEGKGNPEKIVFTQVSKSELEKRRVSVYQYLL